MLSKITQKTVKINSNNKIIEKKSSHAPVLKKNPYFHLSVFLMTQGLVIIYKETKSSLLKNSSISFQENKIILSKIAR